MTRAIVLSIIDFIVILGALLWLDVGRPIALIVAFFVGSGTFAILMLAQRVQPKVPVEQRWRLFFWSGMLGLPMGVYMLLAHMHPAVVVIEITTSLMMLGVGLHLQSKGAGLPSDVASDK